MTGTNQPTDEFCCSACGYSLRGLNNSDRCPECGQAVRRSAAIVRLRAARVKKREGLNAFAGGVIGLVIGLIAAIVPLFILMEISYRITGYDAGNAGVLFCCTVPTFPVIGLLAGVALATRAR